MCRLSRRNQEGFTRIELAIVIVIVIVLGLLLLPALMGAKAKHQRINCQNGLKQVGLAYRQWALDHGDKFPMQVSVTNGGTMELVESGVVYPHFQVMSNELNTPKVLMCPKAEQWNPATNFNVLKNENISYFVGLDAQATQPQMFLAGDRNLEVDGIVAKPGMVSMTTNNSLGWTKAMHRRRGYVLLVEGSVQQTDKRQLAQLLRASGLATNRLAFP